MTNSTSGDRLAEWMLIRSLPDLQARIRSNDPYEQLGISHILRKLLLEARPVAHTSRQRLQLPPPSFEYTPYDERPNSLPAEIPLNFNRGFDARSTQSDLGKFLAASVGQFQGAPITVKMLIKYLAHVEGGVHLGRPKGDFERYLQSAIANTPLLARTLVLSTLAEVGTVVLEALRPTSAAIVDDTYQ